MNKIIILDPVVTNETFVASNQNIFSLISIISLILLIGIFFTIRNLRKKNSDTFKLH